MVSISLGASSKLDKSGGTLTGPLILSRDPVEDLEPATRQWVLATGGGGGIPPAIVATKGDLIAATGNATVARLPAGADGLVLTAASGQATGLSWAPLPNTLPPNGPGGGDLGATYPDPTVIATHLAAPLPLAQGGTNAADAAGARTQLGLGSAATQAASAFDAAGAASAALSAAEANAAATYLPLSGGTLSGPLALAAPLPLAQGGTGANGAAAALASLGAVASDWCDMLGLGLLTADPRHSAVTYQQTPGDLVLCLCTPSKTRTISSLAAWVTAAGVTGSGVNALALFTETGVLIDQTGDMTAAWSSTGMVEGAMAGSHTVSAGVNYYIGFLTHFSGTSPHLGATGTAQTANFPVTNGHYTAIFKSGQNSIPSSFTPSSFTPNSGYFIMYGR